MYVFVHFLPTNYSITVLIKHSGDYVASSTHEDYFVLSLATFSPISKKINALEKNIIKNFPDDFIIMYFDIEY